MVEVEIGEDMIPDQLKAWPAMVKQLIRELGEEARQEIIRLAMAELHTSFDDYSAGISQVQYFLPSGDEMPSGTVAVIHLNGWLPNAIESGWAGGDMKPALLSGRNSKMSKDGGRYNTVPFRHMTPGTTGRHGTPMGQQFTGMLGRQGAQQLGEKVYQAAKSLGPGKALGAGHAPILASHHKTDIFDGMVRDRKKYARATQSQYKSFRRVSDKSDPRAFIHPGIPAHNLFDKAQDYIDRIAPIVFANAAKAL